MPSWRAECGGRRDRSVAEDDLPDLQVGAQKWLAVHLPNMPSVMEDPHVVHVGPAPRETLPLAAYDVQLVSGSLAKMIPIHSAGEVSKSLIAFLADEMNDEVRAPLPDAT